MMLYILPVLVILFGAYLIRYAMTAPQYQRAEAYDALNPFLIGVFLVLLGCTAAFVTWLRT